MDTGYRRARAEQLVPGDAATRHRKRILAISDGTLSVENDSKKNCTHENVVQRKITMIVYDTIMAKVFSKQALLALIDAIVFTPGLRAFELCIAAPTVMTKQFVKVGLSMWDPFS
jgi:hypothetical protein